MDVRQTMETINRYNQEGAYIQLTEGLASTVATDPVTKYNLTVMIDVSSDDPAPLSTLRDHLRDIVEALTCTILEGLIYATNKHG